MSKYKEAPDQVDKDLMTAMWKGELGGLDVEEEMGRREGFNPQNLTDSVKEQIAKLGLDQ